MHLTLRVDLHTDIPTQFHTKRVEWLVKEGIADFVFSGNVRWRRFPYLPPQSHALRLLRGALRVAAPTRSAVRQAIGA